LAVFLLGHYTKIIQAAFLVMKLGFLSAAKKEKVKFSSQEIQRHGGRGREREREAWERERERENANVKSRS
jgi:hypothetical protein